MDCNKANKLMMDYIDFNISQEDAFLLKNHFKECEECKESFELYKNVLEEFSQESNNFIEAPEDFEISIMQKIENIEPSYIKEKTKNNRIVYTFLGMTSITLSMFIILSLNKEILFSNPEKVPILYKYYSFFDYIFNISLDTFNLSYLKQMIYNIFPYIIEGLKYTSLLTIICILIAQYTLYRRESLKI